MSIRWAILAAGESRRLGQPKQLVLIDGEPLLRRQCRMLIGADVGQVLVVLGAHADLFSGVIADLVVSRCENEDYRLGMGTSIRVAATHAMSETTIEGLGIVLVDQWQLVAGDLQQLTRAWQADPGRCVAARFERDSEKVHGPPAIVPRSLFPALLETPPRAGAKWLLERPESRTRLVELPRAASDLDTPQDLPDPA